MPDHDEIKKPNLEQFALTSAQKGAKCIICTEKDRTKLDSHLELSLPILWVQMDLRIIEGQEEWLTFLAKTLSSLKGGSGRV
jgi:tetraacyldisaccharide 4'-kinase